MKECTEACIPLWGTNANVPEESHSREFADTLTGSMKNAKTDGGNPYVQRDLGSRSSLLFLPQEVLQVGGSGAK